MTRDQFGGPFLTWLLEDYADTPLCSSQERLVASAKVMRQYGYRIMRGSELQLADQPTFTKVCCLGLTRKLQFAHAQCHEEKR